MSFQPSLTPFCNPADLYHQNCRPKSATNSAPLPIVEAGELETPGTKDGDVKLVAKDGSTHAFQVRSTSLVLHSGSTDP